MPGLGLSETKCFCVRLPGYLKLEPTLTRGLLGRSRGPAEECMHSASCGCWSPGECFQALLVSLDCPASHPAGELQRFPRWTNPNPNNMYRIHRGRAVIHEFPSVKSLSLQRTRARPIVDTSRRDSTLAALFMLSAMKGADTRRKSGSLQINQKHSILVHLRALGFRLVDREELCAADMSSCRLSGHTDASIFLPCDGACVQAAQQTSETCRTVARQLKCQLRIST